MLLVSSLLTDTALTAFESVVHARSREMPSKLVHSIWNTLN